MAQQRREPSAPLWQRAALAGVRSESDDDSQSGLSQVFMFAWLAASGAGCAHQLQEQRACASRTRSRRAPRSDSVSPRRRPMQALRCLPHTTHCPHTLRRTPTRLSSVACSRSARARYARSLPLAQAEAAAAGSASQRRRPRRSCHSECPGRGTRHRCRDRGRRAVDAAWPSVASFALRSARA